MLSNLTLNFYVFVKNFLFGEGDRDGVEEKVMEME